MHPNDEGHKRMAYVFYAAIRRALRDTTRPVKAAVPKTSEAKTGCDKEFGNGEFSGGLTQHGWGEHDGTYTHNSERKDIVFTIESKWDRDQWFFARLFSRDYDDLLGWYEVGITASSLLLHSTDQKSSLRPMIIATESGRI